jgi:hypothetical protein
MRITIPIGLTNHSRQRQPRSDASAHMSEPHMWKVIRGAKM